MNPALLAAIQKNGSRDPSKVNKSDRIKTKSIPAKGPSKKFEAPASAPAGRVISTTQAPEKRANDPSANAPPPFMFDISSVKLKKVSKDDKTYNEKVVAPPKQKQKVESPPQSKKDNAQKQKQAAPQKAKANNKKQPKSTPNSNKAASASPATAKPAAKKKQAPKKLEKATGKSKPTKAPAPAKKAAKSAPKKSAPAPAAKNANPKPTPSLKQREKDYRQKDVATAKRRLSKRLSLTVGGMDSSSMIIKEVQKTGQLKSIGPVSDLIYGKNNSNNDDDQKSAPVKPSSDAKAKAKAKSGAKTTANGKQQKNAKPNQKAATAGSKPKSNAGSKSKQVKATAPKPKANVSKPQNGKTKAAKPADKKPKKTSQSKGAAPGKIDHSKYANVEAISLDLNNTKRLQVNKKRDIEQQKHLRKVKQVHQ